MINFHEAERIGWWAQCNCCNGEGHMIEKQWRLADQWAPTIEAAITEPLTQNASFLVVVLTK